MGAFRYPGPVCQTKDWFDDIDDGTLVRTKSPLPAYFAISKQAAASQAASQCAFLNPRKTGTVRAPQAAFDALRKKSPGAKVSRAKVKASQTWPDKTTSAAMEQEIAIGTQKIAVISPTAADVKGKNLPSVLELAESLRAIPSRERAYTKTVVLSPKAHPSSKANATIAGEASRGEITLFPMSSAQTKNDFDNRLAHESGHNLQEQLWKSGADVQAWGTAAAADKNHPSAYAKGNFGDDFCEFNILVNTTKGTPCQTAAKKLYPNRWKKRANYP